MTQGLLPSSPPQRLKKNEARDALPADLRETFDKLCEEILFWSQYYYGSNPMRISHALYKPNMRKIAA